MFKNPLVLFDNRVSKHRRGSMEERRREIPWITMNINREAELKKQLYFTGMPDSSGITAAAQ